MQPVTLSPTSGVISTLNINGSRQFTAWLNEQSLSLAFTTYQAGKVFFVGIQPDGKLSIFERSFERCMGLYATGNSLYLSSLYQLWRFENVLRPSQTHNGYDRLYVPQVGYITGDLDIHDLVLVEEDVDGGGDTKNFSSDPLKTSSSRLVFVNTLFSCLATVSETHSFTPLWQPPFISKLAAEDRCHLNGLAVVDGQPRYVTAISQSDVADGWREKRRDGGCLIDVVTDEVIVTGLSMPHSPRWYQGKLWLLNSGKGEFGYVDLDSGRFEPVAFCPGYLRGLAFHNDFAVVGLSKIRSNKTFSDLPLEAQLQAKEADARCGLSVIDLRSGDIVHSLRLEGLVEELYDVAVLAGVHRPMAIGFKTDEIRRVLNPEVS